MSTQDLVAEAFTTKKLEGLGNVFVCRICDTIFVSANDALRHLQLYHRILSTLKLRQVLEESVSGKIFFTSRASFCHRTSSIRNARTQT